MKKRFVSTGFIVAALLAGAALSACGGGAGGTGSVASTGGSVAATPNPTASPRSYQVHIVVGFSGQRQTQTVPGNGDHAAVLAPGGKDGGPLAGARITYPDSSVQIADANGVFRPSASIYGTKNQKLLQTNPQAQPVVVVSDPAGKARPSTARVAAYASATLPTASAMRRPAGTTNLASINTLAGVALLQATSSIFSSDSLDLDVQGSDTHDNVVDLSSAQINYSATSGSVVQVPGTSEAYYFPPAVASGSINDTISVSVSVPGTPNSPAFTASNQVLVVAASSAVSVSGTVQTASGTPIPGAVALFAQLSRYFAPNYWLAASDDNGGYVADVPQGQQYSLVLGAAPPLAPGPDFNFFVGASNASGTVTSFNSGSGASASLDLFLPVNPTVFNNAPSNALPPFVGFVRDAWYNTVDATSVRVFEANNGIQPLLAAVPASFPSPASPAPLGAGQYASWCYQWELLNAVPSLVVAEATGPNCSQPGNDGFVVRPGSAAGTYSYTKYLSNTSYPIASPLDVATNAMLVETGSWSQSLSGSPAAPSSFSASVQSQFYDAANQVAGSPVYTDSLQYSYALQGNGLGVEQFTNDTRASAADGSTVAIYNATKTQVAALASCAGTTSPCYAISGTVGEQFDPASGSFTSNYTISSTLNGDGSAVMTYSSAADASKVVIPLAPAAQQNVSPYCLVCASGPASVYDVDGTTKIGSFTVNNARLVQFFVLDPSTGLPVDTLGFIL